MMFGTIATARLVVPWVMGPSYVECVPLVRWLAPFQVAASVATLFSGTVLYALGRYRAYLASTASGGITAVILYLTLTPLLGLKGACIAFVAGEAAVALVAYTLIPSALHDLWKNPMVVIATAAAIPMVLAIVVTSSRISQPLLVVAIGSAVYVLSCAVMGGRLFWRDLHSGI
jgi:O-antigen/teichoic acid export membrane protein